MTTKLLILTRTDAAGSPGVNRLGGKPLAPGGELQWPCCKHCDNPMQFLAQLQTDPTAEELLLVFMCQADPGCCDEWELDGGANCVLRVPAVELELVEPPDGVAVGLPESFALVVEFVELDNYNHARARWQAQPGHKPRDLLGQLGGTAHWLQADQTPECEECGKPMALAAQLEEGPADCDMNFGGGGCAYVFECTCSRAAPAKMLWQC